MIQEYFQLRRRPFVSVPAPDQYFPASSSETARSSLVRLIERNEGPGMVVGPVGTGKTMLCRLLATTFRQRFRVVTLAVGRMVERRALLQSILFELGLPYLNLDKTELRLSLMDHVSNRELCPHGLLLLVDEADGLSLAVLDELRSLSCLTWEGGGVRLALFGSPRLEEKFTHPRLESFNQRITGRFYLEPFTAAETRRYIERTFAVCGGDPYEVFTPEALHKIHQACGGIPRLVNQLTDHALVLVATNNREMVDSALVDEAWADLQQLPIHSARSATCRDSQHRDAAPSIVEFGGLDESESVAPSSTLDAAAEPASRSGRQIQPAVADVSEKSLHDDPSADVPVAENDQPADPSQYTLVFHSADNPFGDDFEEEEIVVDQFVSPDALAQRHRRQVVAAASERLAEQMYRLRQQAASGGARVEQSRLLERPTATKPADNAAQTSEPDIIPMGELVHAVHDEPSADERRVLKVLPAGPNRSEGHSVGGPSPKNYHNLFSQLRRRG